MNALTAAPADLETRARRDAFKDRLFRGIFAGAGWFVLVVLFAIALSTLWGGRQAFATFGLNFLIDSDWDAVQHKFGALVPIYGTLVTALIAMIIAVPVSFGIALFLTEVAPGWMRGPVAAAIELLAGIPSIIYGMWGLFVFAPFLQETLQPFLIGLFGNIPILSTLFAGPPYGIGMLTAGLILAVMITPYITAVMRDVFELTPPMLKESAYGLGATTWEVMSGVVLPYTKVGVVGGIMLGLGRALGETMAVTFVIGNAHKISPSWFSGANTIASTLANEFSEATEPLYVSSLVALGLVLYVITYLVQMLSQYLLRRMYRSWSVGL